MHRRGRVVVDVQVQCTPSCDAVPYSSIFQSAAGSLQALETRWDKGSWNRHSIQVRVLGSMCRFTLSELLYPWSSQGVTEQFCFLTHAFLNSGTRAEEISQIVLIWESILESLFPDSCKEGDWSILTFTGHWEILRTELPLVLLETCKKQNGSKLWKAFYNQYIYSCNFVWSLVALRCGISFFLLMFLLFFSLF